MTASGNRNAGGALLEELFAPAGSSSPLPRLLVVLAHPDDEVLVLGARLERMRNSRLLCVTDGAPENGADMRAHGFRSREAYAQARRSELSAVLDLANVSSECGSVLRLPSGITVADQACVFHLPELARAIAGEIENFDPEAVLTHPYEGGHPDHDSCAFGVHAALGLLDPGKRPALVEAPFYHSRAVRKPGATGMRTGCFLPGNSPPPKLSKVVFRLSGAERERKKERLACYATQKETLAQFNVAREEFRLAPAYDFTAPPHAGRLLYEEFSWGTDGQEFRRLAKAALQGLSKDEAQTQVNRVASER